jgi:hypothetical protein
MAVTSPRSKHTLTREELSKGGKNGKRGPSLRKRFEELMASDVPKAIIDELKEYKVIVGDKVITRNLKPLAKNAGDAVAMVAVLEAMKREPWAVKLLAEQIDGTKQKLEHTGAEGGPIETESSIAPQTLKQVEDLLYKNQAPPKPSKK